jgi:CheY-like chemotaxis protein
MVLQCSMAFVLVIDDDASARRSLQLVLENAGHSVAVAEDGEAGLALCGELPFDCVVTDMLMPGRDGVSTIMELRRVRPGLRIVAISGSGAAGQVDFVKLARHVGADATLEKPFRSNALLRAVSG